MIIGELFPRLSGRYRVTENGCWNWLGSKGKAGYGRIICKGKSIRVHRISYAARYGEIPDGFSVCHICDNPRCMNPDHLFLGTHAENMADRTAKGRSPGRRNPGATNGRSILSEGDVRMILDSSETHRMLAARYGVSRSTISMLKSGRTWNFRHD